MINKQLGQHLRDLRKTYGYTQEYVASHLDVSRQAYSHYETNRALPSNDAFYKIANLYGIPADSLIELSLITDPCAEYKYQSSSDNIQNESFMNYLKDARNTAKLKNLTRKEKEVLFYFENISEHDQDEILAFLKIKMQNSI